MSRPKASRVQEDFLKAAFLLANAGKEVTNSAIASSMDISPAAASSTARRLGEQGLIAYRKYQDLELTERGRAVAIEVLRHHRLLELFLTETLHIPWELVHQMADRFEHDLDEVLADAIDSHLNGPVADPHGDPIPSKDGVMPESSNELLTNLPENTPRAVTRVLTQDQEMLSYLGSIELRPHSRVAVLERKPHNGPLRLRINDAEDFISEEVASLIVVSEEDE